VTQGDASQRFTAIYYEHHRQVCGYAVSRAGRDLAEDVVGETFLIAWQKLAELPVAPLPWLLGVARNVVRRRSTPRYGRPPSPPRCGSGWTRRGTTWRMG
jgi:RNA polymerase sigma-70 factor, ECF subfamily